MPLAKASDGTEIYFETHGPRPAPAVLMGPHFYASRTAEDADRTTRWIEALQQDFFVIVADYPRGVGLTPHSPNEVFTPDIAVNDYGRIADAAGVDHFGWVGYSYGGAMGVQLACRCNRVAALAIGGFPPLNAPFRFMADFLTRMAEAPPHELRHLDTRTLKTAAAFYERLIDWPESQEVSKLGMPRMVFMGDHDTAQGMPSPWSVPLADLLRAAESDLCAMNWEVRWLAGHDHLSAVKPEVSLSVVQSFLRRALLRTS